MIVYWHKEDKKPKNKKIKIKKESEKKTETLIYPVPNKMLSLNNSNSFDLDEINNSLNQNCSFVEEDSSSVIEICKEIENNNYSETRSISLDDNKIKMENIIVNILNTNDEQKNTEYQIMNEIKNFFNGNINNCEEKIFNFLYLCKNIKFLHHLLFEKIILNLVVLLNNNNKNIFEKIFMFVSEEERIILINEIIKNTPQLITNKNGHSVLLFLISFQNINIINDIIFFVSQNFVYYCLNDYSSEIISSLLFNSIQFSLNYLSKLIKENYDFISKNENGKNIIKIYRKLKL